MLEHTPLDLAHFRLDQATKCLQTAEDVIANDLVAAANRSYYCIFHTMRAVLAIDRLDFKKHSGVISAFRERYIKTGIFPMEYSDIIGNAFKVRINSDYVDFYVISKEGVSTQIENARKFLAVVKDYLTGRTTPQCPY